VNISAKGWAFFIFITSDISVATFNGLNLLFLVIICLLLNDCNFYAALLGRSLSFLLSAEILLSQQLLLMSCFQECGFVPSVITYGCLINLYTKVYASNYTLAATRSYLSFTQEIRNGVFV